MNVIEDKVLLLYGKGLSQRNISDMSKNIYDFEIFHSDMAAYLTNSLNAYWMSLVTLFPVRSWFTYLNILGSD